MPPLAHNAQATFAGGELSPEMYSRIDLAKYSTGLKTARNGFVHPQGGFSNRSGFRFVARTKYPYATHACRLIPFEFSDSQSFMIEVGHQYLRFHVNGGPILFGGVPYEVVTPYLDTEISKLKYTQSASTLYLAHPNHAPMTLVRVTDTNWTLSAFPFTNGPFMTENATSMTLEADFTVAPSQLRSSSPLFQAGHIGALFKMTLPIPAQSISASYGSPQTNVAVGPISSARDFNISTTGTWTGSLKVQKSTDGGYTWQDISQIFTSASGPNFDTNGDAAEPALLRVLLITLTGGPVNITLSANAFHQSILLLATGYVDPTQIQIVLAPDQIANYHNITNSIGAAFTTVDWFEGAWSAARGWPSTVTFYQDRLGWASTPFNPLGAWWSQTGNYVDYGVSAPLVDSDAISVNMPTRKVNEVKHLLPMSVVLALTSSGEISIGPGGSGDFTPTSVDLRPQTYHGSSDVPPVLVGNQAIFVQARSSQVRSIQYQYFTNIFTGEILNLVSTHLFTRYTLSDMTYAESPDSLIFATRSDGVLLCFTYLPEQQVSAWTHWDTLGAFRSCSVIPSDTYDELWTIVERSFGTFVERLAERLPTLDTPDQFHVDCGIDYDGAPTTGISGLDYLEGQSVITLADGNVQGPFTVVGGSITLTVAASKVHIGLPYISDLETLNVELPGKDGTSQGRRQRVAQVTPRFSNSLGGYVGPNASRLHPIIPSPPPTLGAYRPLFTGDVPKISIYPDWQSNGRVFMRQSDPLPWTITGLFPVTESSDI